MPTPAMSKVAALTVLDAMGVSSSIAMPVYEKMKSKLLAAIRAPEVGHQNWREAMTKLTRDLLSEQAIQFEDPTRIGKVLATIVNVMFIDENVPSPVDYAKLAGEAVEAHHKHQEKQKKHQEKVTKRASAVDSGAVWSLRSRSRRRASPGSQGVSFAAEAKTEVPREEHSPLKRSKRPEAAVEAEKAPSSSTSMMPMMPTSSSISMMPMAAKLKARSAEVMQSEGDAATQTKEVQKLECL